MLSILIPIYNYNAFPLVSELYKQCSECNLEFEIICQNDASNDFLIENDEINKLKNCYFYSNTMNLGRGKTINKLAGKANYDWLLILDCDTFPENSNFIKNYLFNIKNNKPIVYGGILYKSEKPEKDQLLRWVYGHKRESLSVKKREIKPNTRALTSNLLLKKELFLQYPFDEHITNYGYEDLCFMMKLKANKATVTHIQNPTFHLNLETSSLYLNKTKIALENLVFINDSKETTSTDSKLLAAYSLLKKIKITPIMIWFFETFEEKITRNLLSEKPSLFLFDLYKLGYFCKLQSK
jgi:hypothetical protein